VFVATSMEAKPTLRHFRRVRTSSAWALRMSICLRQ